MEMDVQEIRIAICDDEPLVRRKLSRMVQEILDREEISFELEEFNSGIELLDQIENIDLVFLDIEMPELDGIETGAIIKKKNSECQIIIASGREDRFKETYRLKAMRFVSKPYERIEVREAIQAYLNERQLGLTRIEVFRDRVSYWIRQRDIEYISAFNSSVEIMVKGILYRKQGSLSQIEKLLVPELFYKVHKAHIVNLFYVADYTDKEVIMKNKTRIPLSRRQKKEFDNKYMEFDIKYR